MFSLKCLFLAHFKFYVNHLSIPPVLWHLERKYFAEESLQEVFLQDSTVPQKNGLKLVFWEHIYERVILEEKYSFCG